MHWAWVVDVPADVQKKLRIKGGVQVRPPRAQPARLRHGEGDIVLALNDTDVTGAKQFGELVAKLDPGPHCGSAGAVGTGPNGSRYLHRSRRDCDRAPFSPAAGSRQKNAQDRLKYLVLPQRGAWRPRLPGFCPVSALSSAVCSRRRHFRPWCRISVPYNFKHAIFTFSIITPSTIVGSY